MSWVWDHSRSAKTDRLVLLAIADCASDDGGNAYPSMAELSRKTGLTDRGVQKALVRLVEIGELIVSRNGGPKGCNRYRVIMATPEQGSPPNRVHPPNAVQGNGVHPPEPRSPLPPNGVPGTPEPRSPGTVLEPSLEPSVVQEREPRAKRATRIPEPFPITDPMRTWATTECPDVDIDWEHANFVDYWRAAPGAKGTKNDWGATWRNWMRRTATNARTASPRRPAQRSTTDERVAGWLAIGAEYAAAEAGQNLAIEGATA